MTTVKCEYARRSLKTSEAELAADLIDGDGLLMTHEVLHLQVRLLQCRMLSFRLGLDGVRQSDMSADRDTSHD